MTIALSGCATTGYVPVKDPTVRIDGNGFSILPPQGPGWYRTPDLHNVGSDTIGFAKQSGSATHTLAVTISRHTGFDPAAVGFADYATKPDVFAAYVKSAAQQMNPSGGRMRILELTAVPETQPGYGAKEHAKFEDRGSPSAPQVLIQKDWVQTYLHPDSSKVIIEAVFSERGLPGESDASLADIRERFFRSLRFRPLQ